MITQGEVAFIRELLLELCTLCDPSEYTEGEVQDAIELLNKLESYDTQKIMKIYQQSMEITHNE